MMRSPQSYVNDLKNASFETLIKELERRYKQVKEIEKDAFDPERRSEAWKICPMPDVRYQMYLEYLAELCNLIS